MFQNAMNLGIIGYILTMSPEERRAMFNCSRSIRELELEIKALEDEIEKKKKRIEEVRRVMTGDNPRYNRTLPFIEWANLLIDSDTPFTDIAKESHQSLSDLIEENKKIEPMTITMEDMVNANGCLFKGGCGECK